MAEVGGSLAVLLVEDNPGDARLIEHYLDSADVSDLLADVGLTHVETLGAGLDELANGRYDVLFLDLGLPETSGLTTLDRVLATDPGVPVVVLTGLNDRETAVSAIQRGAQDYLPKDDLDGAALARALRYAVERYRQAAELRRQNERLERFAHTVSHDLRNPLNVAQLHLDALAARTDADAVAEIETNLARMEDIIDDVLTIAREGQHLEDTDEVALGALAEESWACVETDASALEVAVDRTVEGDPTRLQHLFENLFRNAIEHGSANGDAPSDAGLTVRVGELPRGFFVEDDGPGIPPEDQEAVFDAGFSTDRRGTGLGLNIVAEVAAAHGWEVSVGESSEGGARFEFQAGPV